MGLDIWNPWHGCHKCSEGCRNCYMYYMDAYRQRPEWSDHVFRTGKFDLPLKKDRHRRYKIKAGQAIRVNMTSDTFIEEAAPWMPEFWDIIGRRPDVFFRLLTKRPERIAGSLPPDWGTGYDNVELSISVEDQAAFDRRWPILEQVPAKHKGLTCSPLIGPLDVTAALSSGQLGIVLTGGENYENPRICDLAWVRSLSMQCAAHGVTFCWYESGTRLRVDGHVRAWPRKADQTAISYFSGLNRIGRKPDILLRDPDDGHVLGPGELWTKTYNMNHCTFCANRMLCNGCLDCGDCCEPVSRGTLQDVWDLEDAILKTDPPLVYQVYCRDAGGAT